MRHRRTLTRKKELKRTFFSLALSLSCPFSLSLPLSCRYILAGTAIPASVVPLLPPPPPPPPLFSPILLELIKRCEKGQR